MQDLSFFFPLGIEHIADWQGYDHMLFLLALCLPFYWSDFKKVLWLVTAFTVGHSLTLALSVLNLVVLPSHWIEFLIPITIFITALYQFLSHRNTLKLNLDIKSADLYAEKNNSSAVKFKGFFIALVFGLIHGLGFSNMLKSMLGSQASVAMPLLGFNLGLEVGQICILVLILTAQTGFRFLAKSPFKYGLKTLYSIEKYRITIFALIIQFVALQMVFSSSEAFFIHL